MRGKNPLWVPANEVQRSALRVLGSRLALPHLVFEERKSACG